MEHTQQPVSIEINLRPVRIGFLVDPDDRATISDIVRLATCLWGGTMCPLIPVMQTVPEPWVGQDFPTSPIDPKSPRTPEDITRGHLGVFEPDVLVETATGQLDQLSSMGGVSISNKRRWTISDLVRNDSWRGSYFDVGVGMDAIYEHLHRTEYQFRRREEPSVMLFEAGDGPSSSFFEVAYGMFPESDRLRRFAESYRVSLDAETVVPGMDAWKRIETSSARYPFSFSTCDVRIEANYGLPSLFVFDPCTGTDIIEFWNFRLFRRHVKPFNIRWISDATGFFWDIIQRNNKPLPGDPDTRLSTDLHFARSTDIRRVTRILDLTRADKPEGAMVIGGHWTLPDSRVEPARVGRDRPAMLSVKREEVRVVPTTEPGPEVRYHALVPTLAPEFSTESYMRGPAWVNVAQVRSHADNTPFAELIPSSAVDEHTPAIPTRRQVQYQTWEGSVTFHDRPHRSASLRLPTMRQAVTGWLTRRGFQPRPSDAGHVANDLIESVGGLGRTRLFADRDTIKFLNNMARSRRGRGTGEDEFPERTASIGQVRAFLAKLKKRRPHDDNDLDSFVTAGALRLGVAVKCAYCTKENWYALDDVGSTNRCERCLKSFDFPQGTIPQQDNWKYRVVGPFATPNFAQGAYSVALTLSFLKSGIASWGDFTYSTGLELKFGQKVREADFFAWYRRRNIGLFPNPATLIGECKSLGFEAFGATDVDRLKDLADWFPGAFLIAATLKESFAPGETDALRELAEWGWRRGHLAGPPSPLIVLTARELMCTTNLHIAWRDAGDVFPDLLRRYRGAGEPVDLSKATQEAYLHFQDHEIYEMAESD